MRMLTIQFPRNQQFIKNSVKDRIITCFFLRQTLTYYIPETKLKMNKNISTNLSEY